MRPSQYDFLHRALRQSPVMAQLGAAETDHLARTARVMQFPERRTLAGRDPETQDLLLVMEGQAEYTTISADGDQFTLVAFGPGNWVNWLGVVEPAATDRQIEVAAGSLLLAFPGPVVRAALARHPQAYLPLYSDLGQRFRALMEWVERSALTRGTCRVANLLVLLARMSGGSHSIQTVRMSQLQLARLADCSRQTLNQRLGALRDAGLIATGYGEVSIIDPAGLQAVAGGEGAAWSAR